MLGDGFLFWFRLDGLFIDLGPFVFLYVNFDPVIDVIDVDRVETAAFGPGIVGTDLDDALLGTL